MDVDVAFKRSVVVTGKLFLFLCAVTTFFVLVTRYGNWTPLYRAAGVLGSVLSAAATAVAGFKVLDTRPVVVVGADRLHVKQWFGTHEVIFVNLLGATGPFYPSHFLGWLGQRVIYLHDVSHDYQVTGLSSDDVDRLRDLLATRSPSTRWSPR